MASIKINTDTTPILRKNEEELITAAIKQNTEDVSWIMKSDSLDSPENEYVSIIFDDSICKLPPFKKGTMFGSMKLYYCYSLDELKFVSMKYIVEFGTTSKINRIIGDAETVKECYQIIMKFLDDHNYKSHYQRIWVEDGKVAVDVGSWSEFFWISRSDGSSMAFEEINCLR